MSTPATPPATPAPSFSQNPNDWPPKITYCACDFRPAVCDMAKAVTELKLWHYYKHYDPPVNQGFVFSTTSANRLKVNNHPLVEAHGHSGGSFAVAQRYIQCLAEKGWDTFNTSLRNIPAAAPPAAASPAASAAASAATPPPAPPAAAPPNSQRRANALYERRYAEITLMRNGHGIVGFPNGIPSRPSGPNKNKINPK